MSTTKTTTATNTYNPQSMNMFGSLTGAGGNAVLQNINNPLSNPFFQSMYGQQAAANSRMQGSNMFALNQRSNELGINPNSPAYASQRTAIQRQGYANMGQGWNSLLQGAMQSRNQSIGQAMGYRPLQTGGSQTESVGGTGSWLTPLLSAGMGMASMKNPFGGGGDGAASGALDAMGNPISAGGSALLGLLSA